MINDKGILSHYKESKRIITEARHDGRLVLFVGAGASVCSGMPVWPQAIKEIASHLGISDENLDFLRIPQYYYKTRGKKEYTQLMRKIFRYADFLQKHEIHDRIIEFNTHTIITTNYDNLIEKAAEDNSEVICVVSKDADLPYRKGKELIKIHGDFDNDNFVLKEDDYLSYSRNFRLIENYVKSVIGTNVILFLGYSFNDPDVKQIFSWAKDILDGDFQRAYLIESGKEYDFHEAGYYKNWGINILYASLKLRSNFKENDLTLNLLNMLKWLLSEDELAKLDRLYDELKPFKSMNYASTWYMRAAFRKAGLIVEGGRLSEYDPIVKDCESGSIIKNIAYELYTRNSLTDNRKTCDEDCSADKKEIEKKQRIYNYFKDFQPAKRDSEKIKTILGVLEKSGVHAIEVHIPLESGNGWYLACFELANHNIPRWLEAVNTFDYGTLKDIVDENNAHLSEARPELYTEQGYLYYILKEYLAAYNCFKTAASIYYRHQEYIKYFIAEANRYFVGKIVIIGGIDPKDVRVVKEEMNAVDLDRTYRSLPNLGGGNKVLKDIYTFNLAYTLFQDTYKASERVREQADSNLAVPSDSTAYSSLRKSMADYYNYIVLNKLAVDTTYSEYRQIFRIYFQSIFGSVMTTNTCFRSHVQGIEAGNIHAERLNRFDLMIALKYEDFQNLQKLLQNVSKNFPLEKEAVDYLLAVIDGYKKPPVKSTFLWFMDNVFWRAILFLGNCELRSDLVDHTLVKINECTISNDYRHYWKTVARFLNNAERQGFITNSNIDQIKTFLSAQIRYLCSNIAEAQIFDILMLQTARLCHKYAHQYEEKETILHLIASGGEMLCARLYPYVGESCKKTILDTFRNWKLKSGSQELDSYCILVESKILNPDKEAEQVIFSYFNNQDKEHEKEKESISMFSAQNDDKLKFHLVELYLKGLIIDTESFINIIKKQKNEPVLWLVDYEKYNYELFEINWIKLCTSGLLKEISKIAPVRKKISEKFIAAYQAGQADQSLLDVYFHYFANAYEENGESGRSNAC